MVHLDCRDARPIYTQIIDGFKAQILAGILEDGQRLPSVRDLAAQLSINPNTIQRAYRELELQGWIASVPGKGSFVCAEPQRTRYAAEQQLQEFDKMVSLLSSLGISRQELAQRILQGGNPHA